MKTYLNRIAKHPLGALYGTLLGFVAFSASVPMFISGMWDAAVVDLAMAAILIFFMLKSFLSTQHKEPSWAEKCAAWGILILADILALLPTHNFSGNLLTAFAYSLLIFSFVLCFSGTYAAAVSFIPTVWCCIFMPYHEELMLMMSFPLRLSAAVLSAAVLNIFGFGIVNTGTSLSLPGVDLSITDACSGIKQLDAFILIALIIVQILHRKNIWKLLHFSFIVPSIIAGNTLRIILTVLLYRMVGEKVFDNTWHTALGYGQIILALIIFLAIGSIFSAADRKTEEKEL